MKRWLIPLTLAFIVVSAAYADLPPPDLQAVCRATLKNGQIIEGVILVGFSGGRYKRYYDTNGFYMIVESSAFSRTSDGKLDLGIPFSIDFRAIEPSLGNVYTEGLSSLCSPPHGGYRFEGRFEKLEVYYMQEITAKNYSDRQLREILKEVRSATDSTPAILKRDVLQRNEYELLDYVPIFLKLPKELYLAAENLSVQPVKVKIADTKRFELLVEPAEKWREEIAAVEKEWRKIHPDESGDLQVPDWFHQIGERREGYEILFKPWEF